MNLKRAISLLSLLFANIVLLVHAVVPHHYHADTGICFVAHCQNSEEAHCHDYGDVQTHQHDGNPSSDNCSIDNVYAPANNKKVVCYQPTIKCDYEQIIANSYFTANTAVSFQQKPYLPRFYSEFITRSIGLRAPPCVNSTQIRYNAHNTSLQATRNTHMRRVIAGLTRNPLNM